jgi:hypothetical protein
MTLTLQEIADKYTDCCGNVELSGCTSLVSLPDGFNPQGGAVYLSSCTSLINAVHGCGLQNRTICAYGSPRVVSLGCFVGNEKECVAAIRQKYGDTKEADEYIGKVKIAFSM